MQEVFLASDGPRDFCGRNFGPDVPPRTVAVQMRREPKNHSAPRPRRVSDGLAGRKGLVRAPCIHEKRGLNRNGPERASEHYTLAVKRGWVPA